MDATQIYNHVVRDHKKRASLAGGISKSHDWLHQNRPADHVHCRTCSQPYPEFGDGWDGECPECADASHLKAKTEEVTND